MKYGIPILIIAVICSVAQGLPFAPRNQQLRWTAIATHASSPRADYTALIVNKGDDIITGGALDMGPPLAGIVDMTGPDQAHIIAYLESRAYLERSWAGLARHTHTSRPPLARGVPFKKANMIQLWPQTLWVLQGQWTQASDFPLYQQATVPEPATALLLGMGALVLATRQR